MLKPKPKADEITSPLTMRHDQFFKKTFSDLLRAREFFQRTLPPEVARTARWDTLQLLPHSFVSPRLADSEADLLYLVELDLVLRPRAGKPAPPPALYLYVLFEHQLIRWCYCRRRFWRWA